jgi:hypothetical protein
MRFALSTESLGRPLVAKAEVTTAIPARADDDAVGAPA